MNYEARRNDALARHSERKWEAAVQADSAFTAQQDGHLLELRAPGLGVMRWTEMRKTWSRDEWLEYFMAGGQYRTPRAPIDAALAPQRKEGE